ncbi:hypothetical protein HNP33_004245 [Comamonas odontotermitis]|uniref:DUF2007 domain-containing protein n=1 Tax=Comamonas odontotermitis TaxID=379895 RepID=A0ABR6RLS9_9BURK|nr:hypothetical protein [Comamonas odontotermitis]MBB6580114.1 hypothetical protein [Comamonas odontotermitis]
MTIKDAEVITALTSNGIPLERWLALASHLTGYVDDTGCLKACIIEDDALAAAAVKLLQERGQIHQSFMLKS